MVQTLNRLLGKDIEYKLTSVENDAFMALREGLKNSPFMEFPTETGKYTLITDASKASTGYLLNQESEDGIQHLIACGGRSLHPAEKNDTISELELLSIIEALDKYRHYLLGKRFVIKSDHVSLQFLNSLKDSGAGRLHRWSLRLQQYTYSLLHVRGVNNNVADALSHREYEPTVNSTMEKLRLEETVYSLQPKTNNETEKINNIKTDETLTTIELLYMESRNNELIGQIGKRMSYLLRHGSTNERVRMDNQGYVNMTALLDWLNKDLHQHLDTEDITWIVDNNDKVRFSIDPTRGVKSNYGHSLELSEMVMEEYKEYMKGN